VDYVSLSTPHVRGSGALPIARDGVAHGLLVWFNTDLAEGVGFSNAPGGPELIYGQAFFPWPEAVSVREGDVVAYQIRSDLVGSDYVWTWNSEVRRGSSTDTIDVQFRQSTFLGMPLTKETLARRSPQYAPGLSTEGEVTRATLERMAAGASLDDLARELVRDHPDRFRSRQEALDFASDLSSRYGR
jgi:protein arginine N-methyltransferase 1